MGNQWSATKNSILVALDRPAYQPGDLVQGVVALNVVTPLNIKCIELQVVGFEHAYWRLPVESVTTRKPSYAGQGTHTETVVYYKSYEGRTDHFATAVGLSGSWTIPPGQHQYPFLLVLPPDLPPSFCLQSEEPFERRGEVRYTIKAVCHVQGMLSSNLHHEQEVWVGNKVVNPHVKQTASAEGEVATCCCFGAGHLRASATAQPYGLAGKPFFIDVTIDNNSSTSLDFVEVELMRHLRLVDSKGTSVCPSPIEKVASMHVSAWGNGTRKVQLQLPTTLVPTAQGTNVGCDYFLVVHCKTILADPIPIKLPVIIQGAPCGLAEPPCKQQLQGWHPKTAAPAIVQLPGAAPLPPQALQPEAHFWTRL